MAQRGSKKARSVEQENMVAALYLGVRSPSSGAADNDQGDVRTPIDLIECKYKGGPEQDFKTPGLKRSKILKEMNKIALEAWEEGREPVLAYREYAPESPLANKSGWVDLSIRLIHDDAVRSIAYMDRD